MKYGYRDGKTIEEKVAINWIENENIINHPCMVQYYKDVQGYLAKNVKLKYYLKYERRAAEKKVNMR